MDLVTCPICIHEFNSTDFIPLVLHCGHTFCRVCISNTERKMGALQCPLCRGLDFRDISTIKRNLIVYQNLNPSGKVPFLPCRVHTSQESIFFCVDETLPFCSKCATSHKHHDFYDIDDPKITQGTDKQISDKINDAAGQLTLADNERRKALDILSRFESEKNRKIEELNFEFDKLVENINKKRQEFTNALNGKYNSVARKIQKVIADCEEEVVLRTQCVKELSEAKKRICQLVSTARYQAFQDLKDKSSEYKSHIGQIVKIEEEVKAEDLSIPVNATRIFEEIERFSPGNLPQESSIEFKPKAIDLTIVPNNPLQVELVNTLILEGIDISPKVKQILESTDRVYFLPQECRPYEDRPQKIGYNTTISAPHMHAYTLNWLEKYLTPGSAVLDIGCGSGYLTLCMAKMIGVGRVYGVDHIEELINQAMENINRAHPELDFSRNLTISMIHRDGRLGLAEYAPFNVIHVGASTPEIPKSLIEQLAPGGVIVAPVGPVTSNQRITFVQKDQAGNLHYNTSIGVCYAPLTDREKQCPMFS